MKTQIITKITDAGMIGTIDKYGIKTPGDLESNDLLMFDEASLLLDQHIRGFPKETAKYLCKALDTIGKNEVRKKLAYGELQYIPKCSIFLVSTPPNKIDTNLITEGLFPRLMCAYRHLTIKHTFLIREEIIKRMGLTREQIDKMEADISKNYEEVVSYLKKVKKHFKDEKLFTLTNEAIDEYHKINKELKVTLEKYPIDTQDLLDNFTTRFMLNFSRIAAHHAALNFTTNVSLDDMQYAEELLLPQWNSLLTLIDRLVDTKKMIDTVITRAIVEFLDKHGGETWSPDVIKHAMVKSGKSHETINKIIQRLVKEGVVVRVYEGKRMKMMLVKPAEDGQDGVVQPVKAQKSK